MNPKIWPWRERLECSCILGAPEVPIRCDSKHGIIKSCIDAPYFSFNTLISLAHDGTCSCTSLQHESSVNPTQQRNKNKFSPSWLWTSFGLVSPSRQGATQAPGLKRQAPNSNQPCPLTAPHPPQAPLTFRPSEPIHPGPTPGPCSDPSSTIHTALSI